MITKYYIILQVKVIKMSIFLLTATYNGETIKIFALFHKDKNLIEKFCLIFRNSLFPDKSIFVRNGFYFRSINKDAFPGNFSKRI